MTAAAVSEDEFIRIWNATGGSATAVAKILGQAPRAVHGRRVRIEKALGEPLLSISHMSDRPRKLPVGRLSLRIENGTILVGSDVHLWLGPLTTAQRAFIAFCDKLKPEVVVINGDLFDGAKVSRHPAGMWSQEARPNVKQELEACQAFLDALQAPKRIWTWGNHDARFEARLAAMTPEYEGVPGFALKDHFPEWTFGMSLFVNDELVIKHRWKSGIHAPHNNVKDAGRSYVTGHLHSLKVQPWTDLNGTRYGVDCGTLSDPDGPQFDYTEDNPKNWRSGFAVLTIRDGRLLMPELVQVWDDERVQFRGELVSV